MSAEFYKRITGVTDEMVNDGTVEDYLKLYPTDVFSLLNEYADNYWNYSFQDLRDFFFPEHDSFESETGIGETLSSFNEIAEAFNDSLSSTFGAVTGAMAVNVPLGGGGGSNNDLPKKKEDDDWMPRNLFGMRPKGRSQGLHR